MKPFVWRLQKVLDVKTKEEQFKRAELFRITEHLAQKRSELLLRRRVLQDLMADITRGPSSQRWSAQEFFFRHTAVDDAEIRKLHAEIAELEIRQKQKMAEVLAARRFTEGLERLRARAKGQFLREQEKLEQKELDEKTTISFARRELRRNAKSGAPTSSRQTLYEEQDP
jgi:flagellar biosynthesis chaperone FliJ